MCSVTFDFAGYQVAGNNTTGFTIDLNYIQHFVAAVHFNIAFGNLTVQRLVGTNQQLLTGLATCIKCTAYQYTTKRTVVEQTAIFATKRYTLCHTLVNNVW